MNETIELAQTLARRGWFVFVCNSNKTPQCNWKTESTNRPEVVARWTKSPNILIGINCEQSGIFAVDIDNKHGKDGSAAWSRLCETYGSGRGVPVGPAQRTPSGGYHLIFRWYPPELAIPNKVDALGPGIDLRSRGYICTGPGYTWLEGHGPEIPLSDPPEWLVDLIRIIGKRDEPEASKPPVRVEGLEGYFTEKYSREARIGNRNECAFNLACQLRDCGLTIFQAAPHMMTFVQKVPQAANSRYSEREALATLKSAYSRPKRDPAGVQNGQS